MKRIIFFSMIAAMVFISITSNISCSEKGILLPLHERVERLFYILDNINKMRILEADNSWVRSDAYEFDFLEVYSPLGSACTETDIKKLTTGFDGFDYRRKFHILMLLHHSNLDYSKKITFEMTEAANPEVRNSAFWHLVEKKYRNKEFLASAISYFKEELENTPEDQDRGSLQCLKNIGTPEAAVILLEYSYSKDGQIAQYSAYSLDEVDISSITDELIESLEGGNGKLRAGALMALGRSRVKKAVSSIIRVLKNATYGPRGLAVKALGQIGDVSAIPALKEALKDEDENVRIYAAQSLGMLGINDGRSIALKTLIETDNKYPGWTKKESAFKALSYCGQPEDLTLLKTEAPSINTSSRKTWSRAVIDILYKSKISYKKHFNESEIQGVVLGLTSKAITEDGYDKIVEEVIGRTIEEILIEKVDVPDFTDPRKGDHLWEKAVELYAEVCGNEAYPKLVALMNEPNENIKSKILWELSKSDFDRLKLLNLALKTGKIERTSYPGRIIEETIGIGDEETLEGLLKIVDTEKDFHLRLDALKAICIITERKYAVKLLKKYYKGDEESFSISCKLLLRLFKDID